MRPIVRVALPQRLKNQTAVALMAQNEKKDRKEYNQNKKKTQKYEIHNN
jgi:hypothetical protein